MERDYKLVTRAPSLPGDHAAEALITVNAGGQVVGLSARQAIQHGQRLLDLGLKALLKETP